jgi:regulator of protease activity HflC (stomatin/prohibitin superfamily)
MDLSSLTGFVFLLALTLIATVLVVWLIRRKWIISLHDHERAVFFRFGRFVGVCGPGTYVVLPFIDKMVLVPLETTRVEVPSFEVKTWDGQVLTLSPSLYVRVTDPKTAVLDLADYQETLRDHARTFLEREASSGTGGQLRTGLRHTAQALRDELSEKMVDLGVKIEDVEIAVQEKPLDVHP